MLKIFIYTFISHTPGLNPESQTKTNKYAILCFSIYLFLCQDLLNTDNKLIHEQQKYPKPPM